MQMDVRVYSLSFSVPRAPPVVASAIDISCKWMCMIIVASSFCQYLLASDTSVFLARTPHVSHFSPQIISLHPLRHFLLWCTVCWVGNRLVEGKLKRPGVIYIYIYIYVCVCVCVCVCVVCVCVCVCVCFYGGQPVV